MRPDHLSGADRALRVVVFEVPELGDRSYLFHDGTNGVVVDAQRDADAYIDVAEQLGIAIGLVFETHIHNDYVSGGLELSRRSGARYVVPCFEAVGFARECETATEGDVFRLGAMTIRAIATPGHSAHHLSYYLAAAVTKASFVATGGSLLVGTTGRTDLFGAAHTSALAVAQWRSVRRLLAECEPETVVLPTHGFGSFCAATVSDTHHSGTYTVADARREHPASALDIEPFVTGLCAAPLPIPAYYGEIGALNRAGQGPPVLEPGPPAEREQLEAALAEGQPLVDLRARRNYARAHRTGTTNLEFGTNLVTYLGWLLPRGEPVTLLVDDLPTVRGAQKMLAHIGREDIAAWAPVGSVLGDGVARSYPVRDFVDLARARDGADEHLVVDVRHDHEWADGHIEGALHIALPRLSTALGSLPEDRPIWVYCAAGYRAAVAASLLEAHGRRPVLIDDDLTRAPAAGLGLVGAEMANPSRRS